jgi:putative transposase
MKPQPLALGCVYHIFNRGTNRETLFHSDRDYEHFMVRYIHDIHPVAETYAYCLMKNHFHLAIRTRTEEEQATFHAEGASAVPFEILDPSRQFGVLFGAYAKYFNYRYARSGSLFEHPFDRKLVTTDVYYRHLITYIHCNPQRHGFVDDFRDWPWSSYGAMVSSDPTRLPRDVILEWFGGRETFVRMHAQGLDRSLASSLQLD